MKKYFELESQKSSIEKDWRNFTHNTAQVDTIHKEQNDIYENLVLNKNLYKFYRFSAAKKSRIFAMKILKGLKYEDTAEIKQRMKYWQELESESIEYKLADKIVRVKSDDQAKVIWTHFMNNGVYAKVELPKGSKATFLMQKFIRNNEVES